MAERTYLTTTFKEKDRVKALGARWDSDVRRWYVPEGADLVPFASWLPSTPASAAVKPAEPLLEDSASELSTVVKGVPLSRLLAGVASVVANAFSEGVWTTAEVLKASVSKGHVYLELSERNPGTGEVLAQARAVIWARTAQPLLAEFKRVTGADLDAGIKVLLRAKPVFKSQFGFSLEVDGIDPAYTVGDLEARRRDIRERLKREGLFERNRRLPAPWDFRAVLVIAPERAAGLGDFAKEAERLQAHGACDFSYIHSRFQGEGAAAEIAYAMGKGLSTWSGPALPDAVVIIRGGGSVSDLAWLNDYALARCICECPVPVLSGIGHERDDTTIDEVAHRKFDTPSKVILGIEDVMRARARETRASFDSILNIARRASTAASATTLNLQKDIEHSAKAVVVQARADSNAGFTAVRHEAASRLGDARTAIKEDIVAIRSGSLSMVRDAKKSVPGLIADIDTRARASVVVAQERNEGLLPLVVERAAATARAARQGSDSAVRYVLDASSTHVLSRREQSDRAVHQVTERAAQTLKVAAERSQSLLREIVGQGPQKTLARGFAIVRDNGGQAVLATTTVIAGASIQVDLHDGTISATVTATQSPSDSGA